MVGYSGFGGLRFRQVKQFVLIPIGTMLIFFGLTKIDFLRDLNPAWTIGIGILLIALVGLSGG